MADSVICKLAEVIEKRPFELSEVWSEVALPSMEYSVWRPAEIWLEGKQLAADASSDTECLNRLFRTESLKIIENRIGKSVVNQLNAWRMAICSEREKAAAEYRKAFALSESAAELVADRVQQWLHDPATELLSDGIEIRFAVTGQDQASPYARFRPDKATHSNLLPDPIRLGLLEIDHDFLDSITAAWNVARHKADIADPTGGWYWIDGVRVPSLTGTSAGAALAVLFFHGVKGITVDVKEVMVSAEIDENGGLHRVNGLREKLRLLSSSVLSVSNLIVEKRQWEGVKREEFRVEALPAESIDDVFDYFSPRDPQSFYVVDEPVESEATPGFVVPTWTVKQVLNTVLERKNCYVYAPIKSGKTSFLSCLKSEIDHCGGRAVLIELKEIARNASARAGFRSRRVVRELSRRIQEVVQSSTEERESSSLPIVILLDDITSTPMRIRKSISRMLTSVGFRDIVFVISGTALARDIGIDDGWARYPLYDPPLRALFPLARGLPGKSFGERDQQMSLVHERVGGHLALVQACCRDVAKQQISILSKVDDAVKRSADNFLTSIAEQLEDELLNGVVFSRRICRRLLRSYLDIRKGRKPNVEHADRHRLCLCGLTSSDGGELRPRNKATEERFSIDWGEKLLARHKRRFYKLALIVATLVVLASYAGKIVFYDRPLSQSHGLSTRFHSLEGYPERLEKAESAYLSLRNHFVWQRWADNYWSDFHARSIEVAISRETERGPDETAWMTAHGSFERMKQIPRLGSAKKTNLRAEELLSQFYKGRARRAERSELRDQALNYYTKALAHYPEDAEGLLHVKLLRGTDLENLLSTSRVDSSDAAEIHPKTFAASDCGTIATSDASIHYFSSEMWNTLPFEPPPNWEGARHLSLSSGGELLCFGSEEGLIECWQIAPVGEPRHVAKFQLRSREAIEWIAIGSEGAVIVVLDSAGEVNIFGLTDERLLATFDREQCSTLALASGRSVIAIATVDGELFLWDYKTNRFGPVVDVGPELRKLSFSVESSSLYAVAEGGAVMSYSVDHATLVLNTKKSSYYLSGPKYSAVAVASGDQGSMVFAKAAMRGISYLHVWPDPERNPPVRRFYETPHDDFVFLEFRLGHLVSCDERGLIQDWKIGPSFDRHSAGDGNSYYAGGVGAEGSNPRLVFSPSMQETEISVIAANDAAIFQLSNSQLRSVSLTPPLTGKSLIASSYDGTGSRIAFVDTNGSVYLYHREEDGDGYSYKESETAQLPFRDPFSVSLSACGAFAVIGFDQQAQILDWTHNPVSPMSLTKGIGHNIVVVSSRKQPIVAAAGSGSTVVFRSVNTPKKNLPGSFEFDSDFAPTSMAFSDDGHYFAVGYQDGHVIVVKEPGTVKQFECDVFDFPSPIKAIHLTESRIAILTQAWVHEFGLSNDWEKHYALPALAVSNDIRIEEDGRIVIALRDGHNRFRIHKIPSDAEVGDLENAAKLLDSVRNSLGFSIETIDARNEQLNSTKVH